MPEQRSSSAVRNLRSIFENKVNAELDDPDSRGRSPGSSRLSFTDSNNRPLSKVRASFINVQHPIMSEEPPHSPPKHAAANNTKRHSAFDTRTESFSTNDISKDAVASLKQEVSNEQTRRTSRPDLFTDPLADENAMESTANTPAVEPREDQAMGVIDHAAAKLSAMELPPPDEKEEQHAPVKDGSADENKALDENEPPANPDKPTTGAEEEQGSMKPALPEDENAMSGGQALPPVVEDLRSQNKNKVTEGTPKKSAQASPAKATPKSTPQKSASKPSTNTASSKKPEPIAIDSTQKAPDASLKSPSLGRKSSASAKSPLSPIGAPAGSKSGMDRKASRSSLTAPTAASSARERRESSSSKTSSKPQPRETTKPANLPSHLTAPTAASRARQEAENTKNNGKPSTGKPAVSARAPPKPQVSSSRPSARTSTAARPESRGGQQPAPRKTTTSSAPGESFLERMMRPTASSAQKAHDKPTNEPRSPPRRTKPAAKPAATKANGTTKPAPKAGAAAKSLQQAKPEEEGAAKEASAPEAAAEPAKVEEPAQTDEPAQTNGKNEETEIPDIPKPATENGSATPQHAAGETQPAALESTPAFGEDGIR